jgi:outer membrane protein insertion porin family
VRFGYPVSEVASIDFGASGEKVDLTTFPASPQQYLDFVNAFGSSYTYGTLSAGYSRDTRDSAIQPTSGHSARLGGEFAGGDLQFYRLNYAHQWFTPLSRTYTLMLKGNLGYAGGLSGKPLPFFKAFFAGGTESVRGYRAFSLGPQDSGGNAIGGSRLVSGTAEVSFPFPGADNEPSLRLAAFMDGGQVYAQKIDFGELRYSGGLAVSWLSPFGPLRLSFGNPLNKRDGDHVQRLQFTFGTAF